MLYVPQRELAKDGQDEVRSTGHGHGHKDASVVAGTASSEGTAVSPHEVPSASDAAFDVDPQSH